MKRNLFFSLCCLLALPAVAQEIPIAPYLPSQQTLAKQMQAPITVQFPYENMTMPAHAQHIFLHGQVHLPMPVSLEINGEKVNVFKNGAFVTYLPVKEGNFTFVLRATHDGKTYQAVRHVQVPGTPISHLTARATIDTQEMAPSHPVFLRPGAALPLRVRATPGAHVTARLPGLKKGKKIELTEDPKTPGIYRGTFTVDDKQKPKTTHVFYTLTQGPRNTRAHAKVPAPVTVLAKNPPYQFAKINTDGIKLRKLPTPTGNLYPDYRAYGVVRVLGERNGQYLLQLSENKTAWLEKNRLDKVADYTEEQNTLSFIRQVTNQNLTRFTFDLNRPVPIEIHEYPDRLELTLYYVDNVEENFSLDSQSPVVANVQWAEPAEQTVAFRVMFPHNTLPWGYGYRFEENQLVLDLHHKPILPRQKGKPLAGVHVVLDAGHSPRKQIPYDGAVGPTGYLEYQATLALAEELKPLLEQAGATVFMTRWADNQMSLQNRYDYAKEHHTDLFVSLHYNALPETADPLARPRGFSVYYTYPHSLKLAQSVHQAYAKNVPLTDSGLIENDILFIPRMSEFPSILVESAFLILPEQEQLARTSEGRAPFVKALYEGILRFYGGTPADVVSNPAPRSKPKK